MSVVDNAIYVDGKRAVVPDSLDQTFEALHACPTDGHSFAWIGMLRPDEDEIQAVARGVRPARAGRRGHDQRPPAPEAGAVRRRAVRGAAARPLRRPARRVEIGEVHLFLGPDFVITVRHAEEPDLGEVRKRLEDDPELLRARPVRGALRGAGQGRRRLRARAGRAAGRHRRDRGAGLRRRPAVVPADLPAHPRGDRRSSARSSRSRDLFDELRPRSSKNGERHRPRAAAPDLRDVDDHATRVMERCRDFRELLTNILQVKPPSSASGRTRRWPG